MLYKAKIIKSRGPLSRPWYTNLVGEEIYVLIPIDITTNVCYLCNEFGVPTISNGRLQSLYLGDLMNLGKVPPIFL